MLFAVCQEEMTSYPPASSSTKQKHNIGHPYSKNSLWPPTLWWSLHYIAFYVIFWRLFKHVFFQTFMYTPLLDTKWRPWWNRFDIAYSQQGKKNNKKTRRKDVSDHCTPKRKFLDLYTKLHWIFYKWPCQSDWSDDSALTHADLLLQNVIVSGAGVQHK